MAAEICISHWQHQKGHLARVAKMLQKPEEDSPDSWACQSLAMGQHTTLKIMIQSS